MSSNKKKVEKNIKKVFYFSFNILSNALIKFSSVIFVLIDIQKPLGSIYKIEEAKWGGRLQRDGERRILL